MPDLSVDIECRSRLVHGMVATVTKGRRWEASIRCSADRELYRCADPRVDETAFVVAVAGGIEWREKNSLMDVNEMTAMSEFSHNSSDRRYDVLDFEGAVAQFAWPGIARVSFC
jgi:hypothetical protein